MLTRSKHDCAFTINEQRETNFKNELRVMTNDVILIITPDNLNGRKWFMKLKITPHRGLIL